MKPFYALVIAIGVVGIIIGCGTIYVGYGTISNAKIYAEFSYSVDTLQGLAGEFASGHFRDRSESSEEYRKIMLTHRLEQQYKDRGETQIIIGIVFVVTGLLMVLYGKGKYSK